MTDPAEGPLYCPVPYYCVPKEVTWSVPVRRDDGRNYEWGIPAVGSEAPVPDGLWARRDLSIVNGERCGQEYLRRADSLDPEPSPEQVDAFIREGRIGPAVLDDYNKNCSPKDRRGVQFTLDDCRFSLKGQSKYDWASGAKLITDVAEWRHAIRLCDLDFVLRRPSSLTGEESRFFSSFGIVRQDAYIHTPGVSRPVSAGFRLPRRAATPVPRARNRPEPRAGGTLR